MLFIQIDTFSGVPIFRQIVEQIRDLVFSNVLKSGEQVTSVRELASFLKVNPITVNKAYSILEQEGLFMKKRGIGLFVAERDSDCSSLRRQQRLEEILSEAALKAINLGVDRDQIQETFKKLLQKQEVENKKDQEKN